MCRTAGPGFNSLTILPRQTVDHLNGVVVGRSEIYPDMAAVRSRHSKYRLPMDSGSSEFLEAANINPEHFVTAHRWEREPIPATAQLSRCGIL